MLLLFETVIDTVYVHVLMKDANALFVQSVAGRTTLCLCEGCFLYSRNETERDRYFFFQLISPYRWLFVLACKMLIYRCLNWLITVKMPSANRNWTVWRMKIFHNTAWRHTAILALWTSVLSSSKCTPLVNFS